MSENPANILYEHLLVCFEKEGICFFEQLQKRVLNHTNRSQDIQQKMVDMACWGLVLGLWGRETGAEYIKVGPWLVDVLDDNYGAFSFMCESAFDPPPSQSKSTQPWVGNELLKASFLLTQKIGEGYDNTEGNFGWDRWFKRDDILNGGGFKWALKRFSYMKDMENIAQAWFLERQLEDEIKNKDVFLGRKM